MKNWVTSLVKKMTLFYSEHFSIKKEEKNYTHYQCFSIATSVTQLQHLISEDLELLLIGNETQDNYNFNTDGMQIHSIITLQLGPKLNGPLITVHFFFFFKQDHSEHVHGIMKERNKLKTLSVLVFATKQRSWEPRWASKSGRAPQKTAAEPFINMPSISLHPQDRQPGGHTAQGVHICTYTHTHGHMTLGTLGRAEQSVRVVHGLWLLCNQLWFELIFPFSYMSTFWEGGGRVLTLWTHVSFTIYCCHMEEVRSPGADGGSSGSIHQCPHVSVLQADIEGRELEGQKKIFRGVQLHRSPQCLLRSLRSCHSDFLFFAIHKKRNKHKVTFTSHCNSK